MAKRLLRARSSATQIHALYRCRPEGVAQDRCCRNRSYRGRSLVILAAGALLACIASTVQSSPASVSGAGQLEQQYPAATVPGDAQQAKISGSAAGDWDQKWHKLQTAPNSITLGDHWRVCGLKFRFRNYEDLFRCLDLIEARVAALDSQAPQRLYAPVLIGWMRSSAYAELGEVDAALTWAKIAWNAIPVDYRLVTSTVWECIGSVSYFCNWRRHDKFQEAIIEAGGEKQSSELSYSAVGHNNPAGLDLRTQAITMRLAALRSVLYLQRGDTTRARGALQDLWKWRDIRFPLLSARIGPPLWAQDAAAYSIGALFGFGDYRSVIDYYERIVRARTGERYMRNVGNVLTIGYVSLLQRLYSGADARKFATALEDASNELLYATSLARLGRTEEAEKAFDAMLAAPEIRDMGSICWAALYERSELALKKGRRDEAIRLLEQAVDAIEQVRSTITFEAGKIGFATTKQAVYAALVRALAESGDWGGAFTAAERAKARALVDLLAQIHDLAPPPTADDKVRQLLASAAVNDGMIGFPVDSEIVGRRDIVVAARSELPLVAPEAASLVSVQTAPLADIAAKLAPGETLIDYFIAGDDLCAFIVNGATVKGVKLRGDGLEEEVRAFRNAIETGDASADERGRALYDRLIRPLAGEFQSSRLTISAHGVLHYLPFAALLDGGQYLIDRYSLRVTPSASALAYLRTDTPAKPGRVLALGNPDLGDARYDLPNAQQEALQIAQLFPDSRALVRQEASKTAVKQLGSSFAILHFASHAKFDPDAPLSSGLYLAKGNEVDGRLTVGDLYSMRLDVQLVTLSACQTGLGKVLSGDDVVGLTRGFLYAGARTIVASLWSVDDAATAELMVRFYRNLANHDERESLRLAQIETRNTHPRPIYWAAFAITGSAH
jgi:CHAT domain-containing protein